MASGRDWRWAILPLGFTAFVYRPITGNYFAGDDFLNLYHIADHGAVQFLLTPSGGHLLYTRNAVFYLSWLLFGVEPAGYFWIALFTHLLNVGLLYRIVRRVAGSVELAAFGAALWGICPLNEGSLGWYSAYAHALATTPILIVLDQMTQAAGGRPPTRARLALWYALALASATSFGIGIGFALVLPFLLMLLVPRGANGRRTWVPFLSLLLVIPALYVGAIQLYVWVSANPIPLRASIQMTILPFLAEIPLAWFYLTAYGLTRLLLSFVFPASLYPWICYAVAALAAAWALVVLWRAPAPARRVAAACVRLLVGVYGIIAMARVHLIRDATAEWMGGTARYHYAGPALLAALLSVLLAHSRSWRAFGSRGRRLALAFWCVALTTTYFVATPRWNSHAGSRADTEAFLDAVRAAAAARPPGATAYVRNRSFKPFPNYVVPAEWFPGWAAAFVIYFRGDSVDGRPIRFVDPRPEVVGSLLRGVRTRDLLVLRAPPVKPAHAATPEQ